MNDPSCAVHLRRLGEAWINGNDRMIHYWGNVIEGVFWIAIAGIIHGRARAETDQQLRKIAGRTTFTFFWFGVSDFIEVGTGAWYRPIWLLLMKAACVAVLVHCFARYVRRTRETKNKES